MIYFICGKGGTGKDTVANKVLDKYMFLERVILDTTRPIRRNEIDGKDYNFISDTDFEKNVLEEKYIEYRQYETAFGTWKYGTSIDYLNKSCVIVGPVEMYLRFMSYKNNTYRDSITGIYLEASSIDRLNRMIGRLGYNTDDKSVDEVCRRVYCDDIEFDSLKSRIDGNGESVFKLTINTSECDLESTLRQIYSLINRVH